MIKEQYMLLSLVAGYRKHSFLKHSTKMHLRHIVNKFTQS